MPYEQWNTSPETLTLTARMQTVEIRKINAAITLHWNGESRIEGIVAAWWPLSEGPAHFRNKCWRFLSSTGWLVFRREFGSDFKICGLSYFRTCVGFALWETNYEKSAVELVSEKGGFRLWKNKYIQLKKRRFFRKVSMWTTSGSWIYDLPVS